MLMRLAFVATVLGAAVHAYSGGNSNNNNDNSNSHNNKHRRRSSSSSPYASEHVSVKSRNVGTIYNPTQVHYSKSVSTSRSRKDLWENYDTASVLNLHKTIVNSDKYIKDVVNVKKPLRVQHVNRHHHLTTVLHDHPVQRNLRLTRYRQVVKPAEETIITNSNSRSQKRVWHTPVVVNKAKSVRLPTLVEATKWLPTIYEKEVGNYGWGYDNNNNSNNKENNDYNNKKSSSKKVYISINKQKKPYQNNNNNKKPYKSDDSDIWV